MQLHILLFRTVRKHVSSSAFTAEGLTCHFVADGVHPLFHHHFHGRFSLLANQVNALFV